MSTTYPPGTFNPSPQRASIIRMVLAQGRIETKLFLRHGEQQLLSLVIPLGLLIGMHFVNLTGDDNPMTQAFPMMLAIAATSSGFTGQAIALAFDRRYGALKRTGASGVPAWTIIAGRVLAVAAMVLVQTLILSAVAFVLGWRTTITGILLGLVVLLVGAAAFTALGLLMGGTLSSELVLALANLIWVILVALVGLAMFLGDLNHATWFDLLPSVALASGLTIAFSGGFPLVQVVILLVWLGGVSVAANRWFRFSS